MASPQLRKFFIIPAVLATYYWFFYLSVQWRVSTKEFTWKGLEKVVGDLFASSLVAGAIYEALFLHLTAILAMAMVHYRSGGIIGYSVAMFISSGAYTLSLCNHVFPILVNQPAPAPTAKVFPATRHYLYTMVAVGAAVAILMGAMPWEGVLAAFFLAPVLMWRRSNTAKEVNKKVKWLLLAWTVVGAVFGVYTRSKLPIWRIKFPAFSPSWVEETNFRMNPFAGYNVSPPVGFISFAAQIINISVSSGLFALVDSEGGMGFPTRAVFAVLMMVLPTAFVPLYFAVREYPVVSAEVQQKEAPTKPAEKPAAKKSGGKKQKKD